MKVKQIDCISLKQKLKEYSKISGEPINKIINDAVNYYLKSKQGKLNI